MPRAPGPSGTGKIHVAVSVAYRTIQNGFEAAFTTATALIADLLLAARRGRLGQTLTTYTSPHALDIDEVGYRSYGPDAANALFQVVNDRCLNIAARRLGPRAARPGSRRGHPRARPAY